MNNVSKNFLAAFFSILVLFIFFAVFEVICRSFKLTEKFKSDFKFYIHAVDNNLEDRYNIEDAILMWSPKPYYYDGFIKINAAGFRDKEYKIKKPRDVFRIICLGDSSTFWGNYHSLLEGKLNSDFKSQNSEFEVINLGVTGYTSYQGLALYKYKGVHYNPDIVTFYFGINDPISRFYLSDKEIMQETTPLMVKVILNRFFIKLHSYRLLRKFISNIPKKDNNYPKENIPRVSIDDFEKNILELNKLCHKNGSLLIVISPLVCKERGKRWERMKDVILYRERLERVVNDYKIPFIDIREMTERSESPTIQYFEDTVHPNHLGNKVIMEKLFHYLIVKGLLNSNNVLE